MASRLLATLLGGQVSPAEALLSRLKQGDPEAFAQLVRTHQARIYGFCFRMLGDPEDAKDATQEIFLSLHRALPGFRGDARLTTWMYRVSMNVCLNWKKSQRRRGHQEPLETPDAREQVDESPGPHERLEAQRAQSRVHAVLQLLNEEQRALVVLRDVEGLAYEDITRVTGLPEGTVKSRLHRAREKLAVALRQQEEGQP